MAECIQWPSRHVVAIAPKGATVVYPLGFGEQSPNHYHPGLPHPMGPHLEACRSTTRAPKRAAKATAKPRKPQAKARAPKTQQARSGAPKRRLWAVVVCVDTYLGPAQLYLLPDKEYPKLWTFNRTEARKFSSGLAARKVAAKNHADVSLEVA